MKVKKPTVLYVIYSAKRHYLDGGENWFYETKLHGIFTEKEISKFGELRKKVSAHCMVVPLNKFVEDGVDL